MEGKSNAQIALECASRLYAEKGRGVEHNMMATASTFLNWLDKHTDS